MATGDLDVALLHRIMVRLGELRETSTAFSPATEAHLMELVRDCRPSGNVVLRYLQRHTDYLSEKGFLKIVPGAPLYKVLKLTAKGQTYVQPELAEFGERRALNGPPRFALPAENLRLDRPLLLSRLSRFAPMNAKTMRP